MKRNLMVLVPILGLFSACALGAMKQRDDATQAFIARGHDNMVAAQANARTEKFVASADAWLCPTAEAAAAGAPCDGGIQVGKNRNVQAIGQAPRGGVWPVAYWDARGEHRLFAAAESIIDVPDLTELDAFAADVYRRYPEAKRIPLRSINFLDLIEQPAAYKGRLLVIEQPSHEMTNKEFADGVFGFTIPIPVMTGSQWLALAQFELRNAALVAD